MQPQNSRTIKVLTTAAASICLCVVLLLAALAYRGSKETGGGAAQGDLGFFVILVPVTAAVVGVTLGAIWIDRLVARRVNSMKRGLLSVLRLSAAAWIVLAWDWFFLWFVWRA
jgi:hypothetical protein